MTGRERTSSAVVAGARRVHADQSGLSAGAEALVFGVLVFVVGTIIALNAWAVLDADFAVSAAAREAVRTVVEAGDAPPGDTVAAMQAVAAATVAGHGKDGEAITVDLVDDPWHGGARVQRCARVTVEVRYTVQGIAVPLLGSWTTPITAVGQHSEIVDPYRSGLPGRAGCG